MTKVFMEEINVFKGNLGNVFFLPVIIGRPKFHKSWLWWKNIGLSIGKKNSTKFLCLSNVNTLLKVGIQNCSSLYYDVDQKFLRKKQSLWHDKAAKIVEKGAFAI